MAEYRHASQRPSISLPTTELGFNIEEARRRSPGCHPFSENLDECLVYLDEAHTRGIDLKLPQDARGALTLALGQTKDHSAR
jgi:hypothetical protein